MDSRPSSSSVRQKGWLARLALIQLIVCAVSAFAITGGHVWADQQSPVAQLAPDSADYDIPGGHFFTETSSVPGEGFAVTDEAGIPFWTAYIAMGGASELGYPISGRFVFGGTTCQAMQRVILQWAPGGPARADKGYHVAFLNTLDVIHDADLDTQLQARYGIPTQSDWSSDSRFNGDQNLVYGAHLAIVAALKGQHPQLAAAYFTGGPDRFGLPMAQAVQLPSGSILRTQRAVLLEQAGANPLHPVTLMDVGAYARDLELFDRKAFAPEPVPLQPTAQLKPSQTSVEVVAGDWYDVPGQIVVGAQNVTDPPEIAQTQLQVEVLGPNGLSLDTRSIRTSQQGSSFTLSFLPSESGDYRMSSWLSGQYKGVSIVRPGDRSSPNGQVLVHVKVVPDTWRVRFQRSEPWSFAGSVLTALLMILGALKLGNRNLSLANERAVSLRGAVPVRINMASGQVAGAHFRMASLWSRLSGRPRLPLSRVLHGATGVIRLTASGVQYQRSWRSRWEPLSHGHQVGVTSMPASQPADRAPSLSSGKPRPFEAGNPPRTRNERPTTARPPAGSPGSWG